jgi:GAF domain-containing protein
MRVLYTFNNSRNQLAALRDIEVRSFSPEACWALRRGQTHEVSEAGQDIVCPHRGDDGVLYLCAPLLAGADVIGLLLLVGTIAPDDRFLLDALAENIASALVNQRLQRGLREQSIRDPLTNLYNRRYMEEALSNEIARATRGKVPLSVVMCDVDPQRLAPRTRQVGPAISLEVGFRRAAGWALRGGRQERCRDAGQPRPSLAEAGGR